MNTLARIGLISRSMVYFLIGGLALLVALGEPAGRTTDSKGALRELLQQPYGKALLVLLAFGLLCYATWRLLQGIKNPEHKSQDLKGYGLRVGWVFSGLLHIFLSYYALNLVFVFSRQSASYSEQTLARWLFTLPFGDFLVAAVGIGVLMFGAGQIVKAFKTKFEGDQYIPKVYFPICKLGLGARGFVFTLIGVFLIQAAIQHSPREAGGLKAAWLALKQQPYGQFLVGVVAVGLMAYAFYSAAQGAYRGQSYET